VRPRSTTTLILALAAGVAAGCGSDDEQGGEPIPAEQAAALERQLESIENRFQAGGGACADITGNADPNTTAVASVVDSLPEGVDPDLRSSLQQSFERLFDLVEEQCDTEKGQETQSEEPPPVEVPTEEVPPPEEDAGEEDEEQPPPTEEPPTEEAPPEEVPPEEVPPEELPPGEGGDGESGQGGSGGLGQGGSGADQGEGGGVVVPEAGQ
jgi:hypothetical protein